jgi:hypothetical protein
MAVAAVFSLPLLALHVAAVLGLRFALTRVLPLAIFSLGLVLNGVYGGNVRDYVFIAAIVLVIAYMTVTFPSWAAGRARHRQEMDQTYAAARKALMDSIANDLSRRVADLKAAETRAENQIKRLAAIESAAPARSRLEMTKEPAQALSKQYEDLLKRFSSLPIHRDWTLSGVLPSLEQDAEGLRERVDQCLASLSADLAAIQAPAVPAEHVREGETHCAACGQSVSKAPFCQQCGGQQPLVVVCPECQATNVLPVHLFPEGVPSGKELFCTGCGSVLTGLVRSPRVVSEDSRKGQSPRE